MKRRSLTREQRRQRREQVTAGVVLFGSILLAISADAWVELIVGALGVGV